MCPLSGWSQGNREGPPPQTPSLFVQPPYPHPTSLNPPLPSSRSNRGLQSPPPPSSPRHSKVGSPQLQLGRRGHLPRGGGEEVAPGRVRASRRDVALPASPSLGLSWSAGPAGVGRRRPLSVARGRDEGSEAGPRELRQGSLTRGQEAEPETTLGRGDLVCGGDVGFFSGSGCGRWWYRLWLLLTS